MWNSNTYIDAAVEENSVLVCLWIRFISLDGVNHWRLDLIAITAAWAVEEIKFGVYFKSLLSGHPKPFIEWNITKETADPLHPVKMSIRCRFQFLKLTTLWWVSSYLMVLSYHSKSYCAFPCSNAYKWSCLCDVGGVMWQIQSHITTGGLM